MNDTIKAMEKRAQRLKAGIKKAERDAGKFPEGRVRVSKNKRQTRYYKITEDTDRDGEYIPKENIALAKALVQKEYNKKFLKLARQELKDISRSIKVISSRSADDAFLKASEGRQSLIKPYILTDEQYAMAWQKKEYPTNLYMAENIIYDTARGERVRSKSEALLANLLYELKIPYKYEKPLDLPLGGLKYPDFTLLKIATREEIYFEHFGLLDYEEYRNEAINKIQLYMANGIYLGKNLLVTCETSKSPLDIKLIRQMLEDFFLAG